MESNDFIFETFEEAMNVHKQLFAMMREKGYLTYADLYLLVNPHVTECIDAFHRFGWYNLFYSNVEPYDDDGHWVLKMPELKLINKKFKKGE